MFKKIGFLHRLSILTVLLLLLSSTGSITAQQSSCNNVLHGAIVIDFSSSYGDDFAPENLIDGDQNRSWSSAESDEAPYLVFDLGDTFEITSMQLNGYYQANDPAYQGDSIQDFRLEALLDNQWTIVIEDVSPLQDRLVSYSFASSVVTDQVKISFLSNHGGTSFEAAELVICGQRASVSAGGGGKEAGGKENPENEPLLLIQGDLVRDTTDSWELDLQSGQIVSIELQSTTYDTRFRLFNPRAEQVGDTVYAQSEYVNDTYYAGRWAIEILESGTYSISVFNGIGPYTINVTEGYFGQTVGSLEVGQSVQGNLAEHGSDRWLVELSALQVIGIEVQATTYDTRFRLYDPRASQYGDTVYAQSDFVDNTFYAGRTGIQILEDGLYMVSVFNGIGPYTLTLTEGYFGSTVGTVIIGQPSQGTLAESGFDRWLLALSAGQTIRVELEATTYDTRFRLYDPDGDQFGDTVYAQQEQGNHYMAARDYSILTTGLYMVSVYNGIGDYTISVSSR